MNIPNQPTSDSPRRLPLIEYHGCWYWIDTRLNEFRSVGPPLRVIPFDSAFGVTLRRSWLRQHPGRFKG